MDFKELVGAFKTDTAATTLTFPAEYPEGVAPITFDVLPRFHEQATERMLLSVALKQSEKFSDYMSAMQKNPETKMSDFYETMGDLIETMKAFTAAHVVGWDNLSDEGQPIPFSFETALNLMQHSHIYKWVEAESVKLANDLAAKAPVAADVKKKSTTTSAG